ncbi:hypothetical protein N9N45_01570 [Planktomarina temperata]|nr:hypothetical protein [Planktomarina temperata]
MDNGTTVRAGSIVYRRNGSRNTPINSSASAAKIENMWRERFGLDQTPAVRIKEYLLDIHKWHFGQITDYYNPFQEFTELIFFLGSLGGHDTMKPTGDPSEQNRFWYENFMRYKAWRETNPDDFSTSQPST